MKYGRGGRFRIDRGKMRRIELALNEFLRRSNMKFDEVRLDVVEISDDGLEHIRGVEV